MKLRDMFNAKTAEEQNYFDRLEDAYKALRSQKRTLRTSHHEIMDTSFSLASWQSAALKSVSLTGKPLPADSIGAGAIADRQQKLRRLEEEMISGVSNEERAVAIAMNAIFKGPEAKEKIADFFSTGKMNVSDTLKAKARGNYRGYEAALALDDEAAVKDIAAKVAKPKQVDKQIKKLNALIDGHNPLNKIRRIAWQFGHRFP